MRILGQISLKKYLEWNDNSPVPSNAAFASHLGLPISDISIYTPTEAERQRVLKTDSFELIWTGDNITGIDFALEDAKFYLDVTADSPVIGLSDPINLSLKIFEADGTTIRAATVTRDIPCFSPIGPALLSAAFVNGIAMLSITEGLFPGRYQFPVGREYVLGGGQVVRYREKAIVDVRLN